MTSPKKSISPSRKSGVTIKDIAAELGLSFQAVSQALNPSDQNTSQVSQSTRQRIKETAERLGYRSHRAAKTLRSGKSGLLGVLIFDHPHQVMHHRLHHILAEIHAAGYRPFVHLADTRPNSGALEGCLTMLDAQVEGVLLVDPIGFPCETPIREMLDRQIPVVSIGSHQWSCVTSYQADRRQGYRDLTRHLIRSGCRSLVLLCVERSERYQTHFERFVGDMMTGFEEAAEEARESFGPISARIHPINFGLDWEETEDRPIHPVHRTGYTGMQEVISSGIPDALLCQADSWAHGALRACHEAGVRVPDDLLLTGFNDEPSSSAGAPPLTTLVQPYAKIARQAVADVTAQIRRDKQNEPGKVVTLPGQIVVRASSVRHHSSGIQRVTPP
ncbi:MAG TPA: LacI family DNA-binding transcriptional regulator [Chthoniobacteraceae bacterium]|nr:LacI family DNA-binding transcriptional regulator [Chthoniobacteraceae bacterium]